MMILDHTHPALIAEYRFNDPKSHEINAYIRLCRDFSIDPYDAIFAMLDYDPQITQHIAYPLIEQSLLHIFQFDDEMPFTYFSDSCADDMIETLDFHQISDNDFICLFRRFDTFLMNHDIMLDTQYPS